MPYSASPPELPPPIVAAAEVVKNSKLTDVLDLALSSKVGMTQPNHALKPAQAGVLQRRPRLALVQAQVLPPTPTQGAKTPASSAVLLGNTSAKGYLAVASPIPPKGFSGSQPQSQGKATSGSLDHSTSQAKSLEAASDRPVSSQPSYSVSGASGRLANLSESAFVNRLDQALIVDALVNSAQILQGLSAADLKRLAQKNSSRVAQTTPTPLFPGVNAEPDRLSNPGLFQNPAPVLPGFPAVPTPTAPGFPTTPPPESPIPANGTPAATPNTLTPTNTVEVNADRQVYDERQQVFTAEGNVTMRFRGGLLDADRIQVNLVNRIAVAEGNVALTRGQQVLRGQRFEYNLVQGSGTVQQASGQIFLPTSGTDLAIPAATDDTTTGAFPRPPSDRISAQQPQQWVSSPGGIAVSGGGRAGFTGGAGRLPQGGEVRRLRFVAEQVDFTPEGWVAKNIQVTNDPFSPPELVLRAERATLTRLSPLEDEVRLYRPRLVLDQRVALPFLLNRTVLSRAEQRPSLYRFAYDDEDRGGVYAEGVFNVLNSSTVQFSLFPQIFLQRMIVGKDSTGVGDPNNFGFRGTLDVRLGPSTSLRSVAALTTVDPDQFADKLRASVRLRQEIPTRLGQHNLAFEYSYRDRLFNGSLGFQTVQSSIGALFFSPNIVLGKTGIVLNYQAGYQYVTADTDQLNLLAPVRENNLVSLGRFQVTAALNRYFALWQGKPLPATATQGLRFTPNVVVPTIGVTTALRGVYSNYTSGDTQQDLIATVGLFSQFGHFSRDFFDYTAFGASYSQTVGSGQSPFLFDRVVDDQVLTLYALQQLYGPIRVGASTTVNVATNQTISTNYILEYSRRTHGITVLYNPVLQLGTITLRISDFNWSGNAQPFEGSGVTPVEGGVIRQGL